MEVIKFFIILIIYSVFSNTLAPRYTIYEGTGFVLKVIRIHLYLGRAILLLVIEKIKTYS